MIPLLYQNHLKTQLSETQYLLLTILVSLLQTFKQVKLSVLATALPLPILFESRRKKLQRFLSLENFTIEKIWLPILTDWIEDNVELTQVAYLAIDRTQWGCINILFISLVWDKRAIPIYWELLSKKGSSNYEEQTAFLDKVLPLFKDYKTVVLGDREFCSVKLATYLREKQVYFSLRLRKNELVEIEKELWRAFSSLGLKPGMSLYLNEVRVTSQKGFSPFNVACKWKRKYRGFAPDEGWFILSNLENFDAAIQAYQKRFGIEEMFRDFKEGGYDLEGCNVEGERLINLILLISIAYTSAIKKGKIIKSMGLQKYIARTKEPRRVGRRHSNFYVGLNAYTWLSSWIQCADCVAELMRLNCNKLPYYQKGLRAMEIILSEL